MNTNIIGFSSTPRKNGNSDILAAASLAGAAEAGAATKKIKLHGLDISPCKACDACQKALDTPCVIEDDMAALLDELRGADGIAITSPIYFFTLSAQLKLFLDRCYALGGGDKWDALSGKRLVAGFSYADSDPALSGVMNAIGTIRDACRFLGIDLIGIVHASCNGPGEVRDQKSVLEEAHSFGRKLALA